MVGYISKIAASAIAFGKNIITKPSLKGPFIAILCIYVLMLVLPFFSSYVILLIQCMSDKADVVDKAVDKMMKLFTMAASESTILVAAFIAGFASDQDNDGTPDQLQHGGKYDNLKPNSGGVSRDERK